LAPAAHGANTFTATGSITTARAYHTATLLPNGLVLVTGGGNNNGKELASTELYDTATGTCATTATPVTARPSHTATLLPNGLVLVTGGVGQSNNHLASAELYDSGASFIAVPSPSILSGQLLLPNGSFQCGFTNVNGLVFTVLTATNLSLALINWT